MTIIGHNRNGHRINICSDSAQLLNLGFEFQVAFVAAIHCVALAYHDGKRRAPQRARCSFAVGRGCGAGMDGCEMVRHFRANRIGAITAVRIAHDEDLVRIDIAEQTELADQIVHERIHVVVVEAVPGVVGRAKREIQIPTALRMIFVIILHLLPLAVVEGLRRATATVHGDK